MPVNLKAKRVTKWLMGNVCSVETQDKGMMHILGGMEWDGARFYPTTQNGTQFKTYEVFISGIFSPSSFVPWLTTDDRNRGKRNSR